MSVYTRCDIFSTNTEKAITLLTPSTVCHIDMPGLSCRYCSDEHSKLEPLLSLRVYLVRSTKINVVEKVAFV